MSPWVKVVVLRGSLEPTVRVTLLEKMPKEQKSNSVHEQRAAATEFSIVLQVRQTPRQDQQARTKSAEICVRGVMGSRAELRRI